MFLRGHGYQDHSQENGSVRGVSSTRHQSGNLGEIQGDAARKWTGDIRTREIVLRLLDTSWILWSSDMMVTNEYTQVGTNPNRPLESFGRYENIPVSETPGMGKAHLHKLDISRVTAAANENRPVNMAVKYIIKVR